MGLMSDTFPDPVERPRLGIMPLVKAVYVLLKRHFASFAKAAFLPFVMVWIIGLWQTPDEWGALGLYGMRAVEYGLYLAFWTFFAIRIQTFVLKGPLEGQGGGLLPRLDMRERRFAIASACVFFPVSAYAFYFNQPLFFHMPDLVVLASITALDGYSTAIYVGLFAGWLTQIFAYVLPALALDDQQPIPEQLWKSFEALRLDFSRLFGAALLVSLPVWLGFAVLRILLHAPVFTQAALNDEATAMVWNLSLYTLETVKVFVGGGVLAILWALAFGRSQGRVDVK